MAEEKKGIFFRLFGQQKKSGGCCDMRIVEITEEDESALSEKDRPEVAAPPAVSRQQKPERAGDGQS